MFKVSLNEITFDKFYEIKSFIVSKVFKGNHVHSIVKKKRKRDERFYWKYPEEWSDISFEVVDKSLVNMFDEL